MAIAQKFVSDPKIVVEVGDFSSTASMAASPIYQRAGLVQFGFTNSHPNFTKGGDYMWSNSLAQTDETPRLAKYAADLGLKKVAVLHLNTDWGRTSEKIFLETAKTLGLEVVASEGYQPDEQDFRSTLVRVRDAKPDGLVLISYYADGALIARQVRSVGLTQPIVAIGSVYSPKFIELGGKDVEGVYTESNFFPGDTRPEVQELRRQVQGQVQRGAGRVQRRRLRHDHPARRRDEHATAPTGRRSTTAWRRSRTCRASSSARRPSIRRPGASRAARATYLAVKDGKFAAVGRQEAGCAVDASVVIPGAQPTGTGARRSGPAHSGIRTSAALRMTGMIRSSLLGFVHRLHGQRPRHRQHLCAAGGRASR